jgi:hypothetical protein
MNYSILYELSMEHKAILHRCVFERTGRQHSLFYTSSIFSKLPHEEIDEAMFLMLGDEYDC